MELNAAKNDDPFTFKRLNVFKLSKRRQGIKASERYLN